MWVLCQDFRQKLKRNVPTQARIFGLVNNAHTATDQLFDNAVVPKFEVIGQIPVWRTARHGAGHLSAPMAILRFWSRGIDRERQAHKNEPLLNPEFLPSPCTVARPEIGSGQGVVGNLRSRVHCTIPSTPES